METQIKEIAERIRGLRDIMNISEEEMAEITGVDIEDYRNYESGNNDFTFTFLLKCAQRFGIDISSSRIRNVVFEECGGRYANFRFARIEKTAFKNCALQGADFGSAEISKVVFSGADLREVQMSGVPLCGIDFSSCEIDGLSARPEDLRGAVINPDQAIIAAKILGIKIKL